MDGEYGEIGRRPVVLGRLTQANGPMPSHDRMNRVWGFVIRNRAKLQDALLVATAVAVTTDVIYETDFPFLTTTSHPKSIQPDELPVIGFVLTVGLLFF